MQMITDKEFKRLSEYVKINYGINLTEKKKAMVMGRLRNVLQQKNFNSFSEYFDYVIADKSGEAAITFINKITTNHTFFYEGAGSF